MHIIPSDTDWVYPSIVPRFSSSTSLPESTPPPQIIVTDQQPASVTPILPLAVSLMIAVGVTVVLIIIVIALIAYVNCKPKPSSNKNQSGDQEFINANPIYMFTIIQIPSHAAGDTDLEYNDMYRFQSAHYGIFNNDHLISLL